jgi:hypothetical protein
MDKSIPVEEYDALVAAEIPQAGAGLAAKKESS